MLVIVSEWKKHFCTMVHVVLFVFLVSLNVVNCKSDHGDGEIYTNTWAVELDSHDEELAHDIAENLGFKNNGPIANLPDYFMFVHEKSERRQRRSCEHHTQTLLDHPRVKWAEQQTVLIRQKRGFSTWDEALMLAERAQRNRRYFNDPQWKNQWYMGTLDVADTRGNLGVLQAWKMGYTGKGIVVSIVDDGLDHTHPDLSKNYDEAASLDVNNKTSVGVDHDPTPDDTNLSNDHGTKCAGEVAAEADNNICGVGVAYNAKIGGIRMLDGTVTDQIEAEALGHNCDYIDIFSASWGPKDDGKTFGKPERLGRGAMEKCIREGRNGKGVLYIWATGNGGASDDDCSCDGYTSSIYTLSIASVSASGCKTFYDESCPSTMGVVFTGDVGSQCSKRESYSHLVTTSLFHKCVTSFSGTSCAAPLAAGIFALVLEANPDLTWRDMQHLVVKTARKNEPESPSWSTNGAGHKYSRSFGFGVLNAEDLINAAKEWEHVDTQQKYTLRGLLTPDTATLRSKGEVELKLVNDNEDIQKLEHVQFNVSLDHRRRGDLVIDLISPSGTTSRLLAKRPGDDGTRLAYWPFMTVEFWDEDPRGEWTVKIRDEKSENDYPRRSHDLLFDEGESRDEPSIANDLSHGRFKEDYMSLSKRSKEKRHEKFPQRSEDQPSFQRELTHGRFKEDYMKSVKGPNQPINVASDESSMCSHSTSLQGPIAGCVRNWSLVMYGTA